MIDQIAVKIPALDLLRPGDGFTFIGDRTWTQGMGKTPVPVGATIAYEGVDGVRREFEIVAIHDGCTYETVYLRDAPPDEVVMEITTFEQYQGEVEPEPPLIPVVETFATQSEIARGQGYTGDCCSQCAQFRMKQSGHCLVCDACGSTTGCS